MRRRGDIGRSSGMPGPDDGADDLTITCFENWIVT
jgi:hypothetical protein